jgi:hypothetical protein
MDLSETTEPARPVPAALNADGARAAVRLSDEYFLRCVRLISDLSQGELMSAIVFRAIVAGNIGYLDGNAEAAAPYLDVAGIPPDHLRRPVSVLSVASALGLPYETTRRHVRKLVASGQCRMERGGVVAPASALTGETLEAAMLTNLINLRRLFRALKRAGVSLE